MVQRRFLSKTMALVLAGVLLVGGSIPLVSEASGGRDLVYVSLPVESKLNGNDLKEKVKQNPSKYFMLSSGLEGVDSLLNKSNWESLLETDYPSSYSKSYWDTYFVDNADKLEYEVEYEGTRICQHYASYIVYGLSDFATKLGVTTSNLENKVNGVDLWKYANIRRTYPGGEINDAIYGRNEVIAADGAEGWVVAPAKYFVGYSDTDTRELRFSFGTNYPSDYRTPGLLEGKDAWGLWMAKERAISYVSKSSDGKLNGAGPAMCSEIEENYDKYLPWFVGYACNGGYRAHVSWGLVIPPAQIISNGVTTQLGEDRYCVKMNGSVIKESHYAGHTWGCENGFGSAKMELHSNKPLYISCLGLADKGHVWFTDSKYYNPIGSEWCDTCEEYYDPCVCGNHAWTHPANGSYAIHLDEATAKLTGGNACGYHGDSSHVDIDGAYIGDNGYMLTADEWKHSVSLYTLKVYMKRDRTVSYDGNGATSGNVEATTEMIGTDILIKPNAYSKTGYTFDVRYGWNTKSDGKGTIYKPGTKYSGEDDVTLYAIWLANRYNVVIYVNKPKDSCSEIYCIK